MASKLTMMRDCGLGVASLTYVLIGSPTLSLQAVRNGLDVKIFSAEFIGDDLATGRQVQVPLPKTLHARYLAVMPRGPRHRLVGPFVAWVRSLFEGRVPSADDP